MMGVEGGIDDVSDENSGDKRLEWKSKFCGDYSSSVSKAERRKDNRIMLQLTKPSHTLRLGLSGIVRHETRARLRFLLDSLVRQRNWGEASGVLSVLLKGTCRERLVANNRIKYSAAMELRGNMNIKDIYDLWMKKIGSIKSRPVKDKFALLEFTVSCLGDKTLKEAPMHAICLMQDHVDKDDPISNLILGLCHDELLYDTLPNNMQLTDSAELNMSLNSEGSGMDLCPPENWDAQESVDPETCCTHRPSSATSVRNDKINTFDSPIEREKKKAKIKLQGKETSHQIQGQGLYANSADTSLDRNLLPDSSDNMEVSAQLNHSHRDAVKYLQNALNSTPPALEALLPLVQLLLVGHQVKRAFDVVERFCEKSDSVLPIRLMAHLLECHDPNNLAELSVYYEKLLRRDPTCRRSIRRLVHLYEIGSYNPEKLVEMMGLHLDAAFPDSNIWRAFSLCMSRLSPWKGDRMSTCENEVEFITQEEFSGEKVPPFFANGVMERNWKICCKWWLNRHFSKKMFTSEVAAGDLVLMAYKAACASHLYGAKFQYVVKVVSMLEKKEEDPVLSFMREHIQYSCGFFCQPSVDTKRIIDSQPAKHFRNKRMIQTIEQVQNKNWKEEMEAAVQRWEILRERKKAKKKKC